MFVGTWIIGPSLSNGTTEYGKLRSAKEERAAFESAVARPDPSPYRYPTPTINAGGPPAYGKIAKMRAQSEYPASPSGEDLNIAARADEAFSGLGWQDRDPTQQPAPSPRYRPRDRHTGVTY
jgi:hypothetical protein